MTFKNNRAPLLCYFKLCAAFCSHWWIQTEVTVRKRLISVKIDDFFSRVTLICDGWPSKTIGHLDFPGILRQNGKTQRLFSDMECQILWLLLDARTTVNNVSSQDDKKLSLQCDNQVISWIKIITCHTFQNPYMKFPDIFLTFAPFQNFPDIFSNSLTIPWPWKKKFFPDFSLTRGNPDQS